MRGSHGSHTCTTAPTDAVRVSDVLHVPHFDQLGQLLHKVSLRWCVGTTHQQRTCMGMVYMYVAFAGPTEPNKIECAMRMSDEQNQLPADALQDGDSLCASACVPLTAVTSVPVATMVNSALSIVRPTASDSMFAPAQYTPHVVQCCSMSR
jgi:hypothetical protein